MANIVNRIDTVYFDDAIADLNNAIKAFDNALSNIQTQTSRLQETWNGSGADKFDSAYGRLKKEFDDQYETLSALRDDLQTILETYQSWDTTTQGAIAGDG